jgi:hypothetical protein
MERLPHLVDIQADAEIIGERGGWGPFPGVPGYVKVLFLNRYGRSGRGRLWVKGKALGSTTGWDNLKPTCRAASHCGGIVFHRADLAIVGRLPGFITDGAMDLVS